MEQVKNFLNWLVAGDVADKEAYLAERRARAKAAKRVVMEKGRSFGATLATPPVSANRSRNRQSQMLVK